jgi:hypothetical protein
MGMDRISLIRLLKLLPILFLVNAMFADAASPQASSLQIKVLSSEFHALNGGTPVPKDCDLQNYSAYCNESRNPTVENVMVVQDSDGKSFSIACTVDSRWSKCEPLPVGQTFDARKDKHGITVLYRDAKGKERKQLFQLLAAVPAIQPRAAVTPKSGIAATPTSPAAAAPPRAPTPAAAPPAVAVQQASPEKVLEKAKCNFSSTPSGADIILDGKYVGSTPSVIPLSSGTHVVIFSMTGFSQWKRELTVLPGSELTVGAILQKEQP